MRQTPGLSLIQAHGTVQEGHLGVYLRRSLGQEFLNQISQMAMLIITWQSVYESVALT